MAMTPSQFVDKWTTSKFTAANYDKIDDSYFREFTQDLADTFGIEAVTVPTYKPGFTYSVSNLVRFTLLGSPESFFYALQAGKLPSPVAIADPNWKVVPGPVPPAQLSQSITLAQAKNINGDTVVLGRAYAIELPLPSASGHQQLLSTVGIAEGWFASDGWLIVNNVRTRIEQIDYVAGTWEVASSSVYTKTEVDTKLKRYTCALVFQHADPLVGPDFHEVAATITRVALNPQAAGLGISTDGGGTYTNLAFTAGVWAGTLAVPAGSSVFYQLTFAPGQDAAGAIITTLDA